MAALICSRFRPELKGLGIDLSALPKELTLPSLNELLGLLRLFGGDFLHALCREDPGIGLATPALMRQGACLLAAADAFRDWPHRWHAALGEVALQRLGFGRQGSAVVEEGEVRDMFAALKSRPRSPCSEVPTFVRRETASFFKRNAVRLDCRRFLGIESTSNRPVDERDEGLPPRPLRRDDLLSMRAVRTLFDATPAQMESLDRLGVFRQRDAWTRADVVLEGLHRLGRHARARRPSTGIDYVSIRELDEEPDLALDRLLADVVAGRLPSAYAGTSRPAGLGNLYVCWESVQAYLGWPQEGVCC
jgi:hypothetical protein